MLTRRQADADLRRTGARAMAQLRTRRRSKPAPLPLVPPRRAVAPPFLHHRLLLLLLLRRFQRQGNDSHPASRSHANTCGVRASNYTSLAIRVYAPRIGRNSARIWQYYNSKREFAALSWTGRRRVAAMLQDRHRFSARPDFVDVSCAAVLARPTDRIYTLSLRSNSESSPSAGTILVLLVLLHAYGRIARKSAWYLRRGLMVSPWFCLPKCLPN